MLTEQEKQIMQYGAQQGKSASEIKAAIAKFRNSGGASSVSQTPTEQESKAGVVSRVSDVISTQGERVQQAISGEDEFAGQTPVRRGVEATAEAFKAIPETAVAVSPEPVRTAIGKVGNIVGSGFSKLTSLIGDIPALQKWTQEHPEAARTIEEIAGTTAAGGEIAGSILAAEGGLRTANAVGKIKTPNISLPKIEVKAPNLGEFGKTVNSTFKEVTANISPQQLSERSFARAFKLAPSDVVDLDSMAGSPVSEWALANKLIKNTGDETIDAVTKFKTDNYNAVRDAVSVVDDTYSFKDVPELENIIDNVIKDTEGLRSGNYASINSELKSIVNRFNKGTADLSDVQYVKSVLDDVESIYKRSSAGGSELKEGLRFQDLGSSRNEVQKFIEDRVSEKFPEINIRELNRNVRVSKGLIDSIIKRAGKFDTQSTANLGDYFVFGLGQQALPGTGIAAVAIKKVVESQPVKLKLTQVLSKGKNRISETDIKAVQDIIRTELENQLDL